MAAKVSISEILLNCVASVKNQLRVKVLDSNWTRHVHGNWHLISVTYLDCIMTDGECRLLSHWWKNYACLVVEFASGKGPCMHDWYSYMADSTHGLSMKLAHVCVVIHWLLTNSAANPSCMHELCALTIYKMRSVLLIQFCPSDDRHFPSIH